tara:strand:+ start:3884 stop:4291 length:408 start_codon:yes stop_codon:yes gene_type:complete
MRFVSQLIPFWWVVRTVDAFIPFLTTYINSILFVLYGVVAGSVYVLDCYPKWQAKLIAMGTDRAVANTLVLGEWLTSVFASMVSVYWFIPTLFLPHWFVLMAVITAACHLGLIYAWESHYSSLLRQYDMHLDDSI